MAASHMPTGMSLGQLLPEQALSQEVAALPVIGLCLDSRRLQPGDLFLAVPGNTVDGRRFIDDALAAGAVAVLAEAEGLSGQVDGVVPVAGLNAQISDIAGRFYGEPSAQLSVTGITGTNGKTTCSQLLAQLFSLDGAPAAVIGTLGHGFYRDGRADLSDTGMTTPDAVTVQSLLADYVAAGAERVAMEVSSHSLDQARVAGVHFTTAVFTNLSRDHLDYHGDLVSYAQAKMRLFSVPGVQHAVINIDDPVGAEIASHLSPTVELFGYSLKNPGAQITAEQVCLSADGISAQLRTPWGDGELRSPLLGRFNLENLLAVVAVACAQGMTFESVLSRVPELQSVPGRMEMLGATGGPRVVIDYAHTPGALESVLSTLREHCDGQLWCVFGCGGDRDKGKRPLMGEVASRLADRVVVTSDNPRGEDPEAIINDILGGLVTETTVSVLAARDEAVRHAIDEAGEGDLVLIAGKGHEEYQLVGSQRLPFSDRAEARLALQLRGRGK